MKHISYISIGSNLGDRMLSINQSIYGLSKFSNVLSKSHVYESPSWGYSDKNSYFNLVVKLKTDLNERQLMESILKIEKGLGRERSKENRYHARTIDLDIIFFDDLVLKSEDLIIPHPRYHKRNFVLVPLNDISPELVCPVFKKTIKDLLIISDDLSKVSRL
tara:strand:+ start:652 stop:1137 length:486 start_codon:yes stop_codon:yes gene_type:complete